MILDEQLSRSDFSKTLNLIRSSAGHPDIVVLSEQGNSEERARLLSLGCLAVLHKGLTPALLRGALETLLSRRRESLRAAEKGAEPSYSLVAKSAAMRSIIEIVHRVAPTTSSVLILGETGVGKEELAKAIHLESGRSKGPFIAVNCGAIPEALAESELFGHVQGAFTGADRNRRGCFERAHTGTLFLDEFVEMPLQIQVKVLRAIQELSFQPVGAEDEVRVDIRIIAATNRDPEAAIRAGRLREDLYYRVAVMAVNIPPLRERPEDIKDLAQTYFNNFRKRMNSRLETISEPAMNALAGYAWPGNIRELINVMERSVMLATGTTLRLEDICLARGPDIQPTPSGVPIRSIFIHKSFRDARKEAVDMFERSYFETLLKECQGRVGTVATKAGVTRRALFQTMKRLGISKDCFR